MKNNQLNIIIRCLKEIDIYSLYIHNFNQHRNGRLKGSNILECLKATIAHCPDTPLSSTAIGWNWEESNEGSNFWREQNKKLTFLIGKYKR